MTDFFKEKNLLALYPAEDSGFPMRFYPLKTYFKSVHLLNYAETCCTLGIGAAEKHIRDLISREKIDVVLCCPFASDYQLSVDFFASLRKKVRLAFWFPDDSTYFESYNRYYAQAADAIITPDPFAEFAYKRLEIPALVCQDLTASNQYFPVKTEKTANVCFIGDLRKRGRREYIEFLEAAGINVLVYGQGTANGYLPPEKISEYTCKSRINLNFSQIGVLDWKNGDEPLLNRVRQNTGRPREIALTGAFCLSEYSPSLEMMFKPGKEIDSFRDKAELLEKVKFYLANPEKREEMARAAHEYAEKHYRADAYAPRLLRDLADRFPEAQEGRHYGRLYFSRGFKTREINSLTFILFVMLKRRSWGAALELLPRLFKHGPLVFLAGFAGGLRRVLGNASGKVTGKR